MTPSQLEKYRERLVTLGKRVNEEFNHLQGAALHGNGGEASGSLSNAPLHPADLGTDAFEAELALGLLAKEEHQLEDINAALERIRQGTYGICEECKQEILLERLDALPYTPLCIDCARKLEVRPEELNDL